MAFIPDSTLSGSPIGNLNAMVGMLNAHATSRVSHVVIANSGGLYEDNGVVRALGQVLSSHFQCFDLGVFSPFATPNVDFGGGFYQRLLGQTPATITKAVDPSTLLSITGTYADATKRITANGPAVTGISVAAAAVVTFASPHNLISGDSVTFAATNSTPNINGARVCTVLTPTTVTVPVTTTVAGTSGTSSYNVFAHFTAVAAHSHIRSAAGTGVTNTAVNVITASTTTTIDLTTSLGAGADGQTVTCLVARAPSFMIDACYFPAFDYAPWLPHSTGFYYVAPATSDANTFAAPLLFKRQNPLGVNSRMKHHVSNLQFASGTGTYRPSQYIYDYKSAAYGTRLNLDAVKTTSAGVAGQLDRVRLTGLSAHVNRTSSGGTDTAKDCLLFIGYGGDAASFGSLAMGYAHISGTDRSTGYSVQALACRGGMSRYRFANLVVNQMSDTTLETYFCEICDQHSASADGTGAGVTVVWVVDSFNSFGTGNDVDGISKSISSIGPVPAASNTAAGHTDNLKAIVTELTARIAAAGVRESVTETVYFVFVGDWCVSDAPTAAPSGYSANADVEGWKNLGFASDRTYVGSTTNVIAVNLSAFATCAELATGGHIAEDASSSLTPPVHTDNRHLGPGGYDLVYGRLFSRAMQAVGAAAAQGLTTGGGVAATVGTGQGRYFREARG